MKFAYKAITREKKTVEGEAKANDKFDLARRLKQEGKTVTVVEEISGQSSSIVGRFERVFGRVKLRDRILFMRNLGAMLEAGLPLLRALGVLQKQTKNKRFQTVLKETKEEINKGGTLSGALEKNSRTFSPLAVAMVRAGEESGKLPESLKIISEHLERSYLLRKRIRGALMYPLIVISAMVLIGVVMLIYVVPTLVEVFEDLNTELPASTKTVIFISSFLKENTFFALGLLLFIIFAIISFGKSEQGKYMFETIFLHVPIIGELIKQTNSARTARTLSSLLSSGVKMVDALSITRDVVQNSHYKEVIKDVEARVQKGTALSHVFSEYENLYPTLVGEMVSVGEETGNFSDMLMRVAVFYEGEVEQRTKDMSTIIEPILMIVVGIGVGFFAISMITPLYSVMQGI